MTISDELITVIDETFEAQRTLGKSLATYASDRTSFQIQLTIPNSHQNLIGLDSEIATIGLSVRGIVEQDLTLVPLKSLEGVRDKLGQILGNYKSANAKINAGIPIQSITPSEYAFSDKDGNRQSLAKDLESASATTEDILTDWHILRLAAKSPRINDFAAFLRLNNNQRENIEKSYQEIQEIKLKAETLDTSVETIHSEASEAKEEIDRLKSIIGSDRKNISEFVAESSVKIESIRKTSSGLMHLAPQFLSTKQNLIALLINSTNEQNGLTTEIPTLLS